MTYALVQVSGEDRRYWRHHDGAPSGSWESDRGLATRWSLPKHAHMQKARLLLHVREKGAGRVTSAGLTAEGVLRLRVAKLKAKTSPAPVDLDTLWQAAELGLKESGRPLCVTREVTGLPQALRYVAHGTTDRGLMSVASLAALPDLLAFLGQSTPTTETP